MSRGNTWTKKQLRILITEYPLAENTHALAKKIGKTYAAIKSRAGLLQLHRQVHNRGFSNATKRELDYIRKNYLTIPIKTMADNLGGGRSDSFVKSRMDAMGLVRPPELIQKVKDQFRFKPGTIPPNTGKKQRDYMSQAAIKRTMATRFKKGQISRNALFDGAITIRKARINKKGRLVPPHKYIRISKRIWKELQIYNWEKKKGLVPKGYVLACKDGNTLNCKPSNWFLMTMADNVRRNSIHRYPMEIKQAIRTLGKLNKIINEKQNRRSA